VIAPPSPRFTRGGSGAQQRVCIAAQDVMGTKARSTGEVSAMMTRDRARNTYLRHPSGGRCSEDDASVNRKLPPALQAG